MELLTVGGRELNSTFPTLRKRNGIAIELIILVCIVLDSHVKFLVCVDSVQTTRHVIVIHFILVDVKRALTTNPVAIVVSS